MDNLKTCKRCLIEKPMDSFVVSKKTGNPVNPCLTCVSDRKRGYRKKYDATHKEINNATKKRWAANNPIKILMARNKWKSDNIGQVKADKAKRKFAVMQATPKWLDEVHLQIIACKYEMAELKTQATGIAHNVDHIVPIRGKDVCGLNVPWNLEVITAKENIWKSNKLLPWRANSGYYE